MYKNIQVYFVLFFLFTTLHVKSCSKKTVKIVFVIVVVVADAGVVVADAGVVVADAGVVAGVADAGIVADAAAVAICGGSVGGAEKGC